MYELAVDVADARRADGAIPRDIADRYGARGGIDRQHVEQVDAVRGEGRDDDLHLVAHALGEERAQRPVRQARG